MNAAHHFQSRQADVSAKERLADQLVTIARTLKQSNQHDLAGALLLGSQRLRIQALDLQGRIAAATLLGRGSPERPGSA